jgi:putative DNA primase/helicase
MSTSQVPLNDNKNTSTIASPIAEADVLNGSHTSYPSNGAGVNSKSGKPEAPANQTSSGVRDKAQSKRRRKYLADDPLPFPPKMTGRKQWICWKLTEVPGKTKLDKTPFNPVTGTLASSDDPGTWTDYATAVQAVRAGKFDALGFVLTKDTGLVVLDIEECIDESGHVADWAQREVDVFDSFTERSVSSGLHCLGWGEIPSNLDPQKVKGEIWDRNKMFCFTGNLYEDRSTIEKRNMLPLHTRIAQGKFGPNYRPPITVERYNTQKFTDICNDDWAKYELNSRSEAVQSALCTLAIKHNFDAEKIRDEFETTELCDAWEETGKWTRLSEREIERAIEFVKSKARVDNGFPHTETGNAERFVSEHGNDFRYVHDLKQWYQWDGKRWARDAEGEVHRRFKETAQNMLKAAAEIKDDRQRQENAKWALKCQSEHTRRASVALAAMEKSVSALRGQFDQDKYLLNVANGTLDLRTFTLRPHSREDMLTKIIPVPYNPEAKCPRWLQFLDEIFPGQPETIDFLQRSLGYTLTGSIDKQCLWLLIGVGKNGKSVFLCVIHHVMGDYAVSTSFNTFTVQNGRTSAINPRDGLASLEGARFVRASESDEGKQVSESLLKALTGGEQVRTARMYADDYVYDPTFKIWLSTNHEPAIKGTDDAIWRRIHRVNFEVIIPEDKRDFQLTDKLISEAEGILAWAVEGLKKYRKDGLCVPERVKKATQEYRTSQDIVARFLAECTVADDTSKTGAKELFGAFRMWADFNGEGRMSSTAFGKEVKKRYERKHTNIGEMYSGIKLKEETAQVIPDDDIPF